MPWRNLGDEIKKNWNQILRLYLIELKIKTVNNKIIYLLLRVYLIKFEITHLVLAILYGLFAGLKTFMFYGFDIDKEWHMEGRDICLTL